ncbi:MAG TPA: hypothetical protein VN429_00990 [Methanospirillum sp.]|uniref:S8 family serine peptidase n=1 Tax=Methanospirillum sp. TaxID=45200 RepID=UPI002BAC4377|nr:hypothetical protein [Methanospirillum sp.]HWQ62960.1 hypothetical protein [Methanospirillum sp.]
MRQNALVLTLIAGLFLAVIVLAQTAPSEAVNNTTAIPGDNKTTPPTPPNVTASSYVQGELLVQFNTSAFPNNQSIQAYSMQANAAIGAVVKNDYSQQGIPGLELVVLPPGMTIEQGISYYQSLPTVKYAEKNAIYSIASASGQNSTTTTPPPAGNTSASGGLFVRYNQTAFHTTQDMFVYANTTNAAIHASVMTDYTAYGMPGLQLVSLQPNMTTQQGLTYYRNVTNVLYAEPNVQYTTQNTTQTQNNTKKA